MNGPHTPDTVIPFALRPSEYTAALIQALRAEPARVRGVSALEIGSGSGVVLATLGSLGAASLCGVDIEHAAVEAGQTLMRSLGSEGACDFRQGDMWAPVAGRRFGLIAANLPHFAMEHVEIPGRLPTWSSGGADGRELLDRFLDGLPAHLEPGGRAVLTHNGFVGVEQSRAMVARHGMALRPLSSILVHVP
jgi:release factor glutamine methyltransferase